MPRSKEYCLPSPTSQGGLELVFLFLKLKPSCCLANQFCNWGGVPKPFVIWTAAPSKQKSNYIFIKINQSINVKMKGLNTTNKFFCWFKQALWIYLTVTNGWEQTRGTTLFAEVIYKEDFFEEALWGCIQDTMDCSQERWPGLLMETDDDASRRQMGAELLLQAPV